MSDKLIGFLQNAVNNPLVAPCTSSIDIDEEVSLISYDIRERNDITTMRRIVDIVLSWLLSLNAGPAPQMTRRHFDFLAKLFNRLYVIDVTTHFNVAVFSYDDPDVERLQDLRDDLRTVMSCLQDIVFGASNRV